MEEMTGKGKNDASCAAHISYIHPLSIVDEGSDIGSGTRVWAGAHVMTGAKIGQDCNIGEHCFVEGGVTKVNFGKRSSAGGQASEQMRP